MINKQVGLPNRDRQENDLYCTNPIALEKLLDKETFNSNVWECCNGLGHLSNLLKEKGYNVRKSDIIKYNEDDTEIMDFLNYDGKFAGDIITNPPYKEAEKFITKAMETVEDGNKVAMYLRINFLSSQKRYTLFKKYPPKTVYIMCKRYSCAKEGDFLNATGTVDYCWIVWEKGSSEETKLEWIL